VERSFSGDNVGGEDAATTARSPETCLVKVAELELGTVGLGLG